MKAKVKPVEDELKFNFAGITRLPQKRFARDGERLQIKIKSIEKIQDTVVIISHLKTFDYGACIIDKIHLSDKLKLFRLLRACNCIDEYQDGNLSDCIDKEIFATGIMKNSSGGEEEFCILKYG